MVKELKKKRAIAMIELIFALVIMGIVLISTPLLIQQSIKSSNVALQQEAIVTAASQAAIILSMHWDEKNANIATGESPILDANRTAFPFPPAGLNSGVFGRNTTDGNETLTPSTTLGADSNETSYTHFDDVDDYHNSSFGLMLFNQERTTADIGEYVDTKVKISTTVKYTKESSVLEEISTGPFSNIKAIQIRLTSNLDKNDTNYIAELSKEITFQAFSCNIGTYSIYGKEFP